MIGRRLPRGVPFAWYLLLALVLTWPMVRDPTGAVLGHPEASAGCHVWVIWWAQQGISELYSSLIFFPYGASVVRLYGSDVLSPILLGMLPFSSAFLFNLWVLVLLVTGGLGMHRLCRFLGATDGGALTGGTVFAAAPFLQHELLNGTTEMLAIAALPWFAFALLRVLEAPSVRGGALFGLITGLGISANGYNLFFMALLGASLVLYRLTTRPEPVLTRPVLQAGGVGVAVSAVFGVPLAWLQFRYGLGDTYRQREGYDPHADPLPDSYADVLDWFDPRAADIPYLWLQPDGSSFSYWTTCTVYLGLVALVMAAVTLWRRRTLGQMGLVALVGLLVALGPFVRVGGELVTVMGTPIPLPTLLLAEVVPAFRITALHTYRYAALVVLGVAALASLAVRHPGWSFLVLVEAIAVSPVPWPAATTPHAETPVLQALADARMGAVLTIPAEESNLGDLGRLLMAQIHHGKPVHDGGIHRRAGEQAVGLWSDVPALYGISQVGGLTVPELRETRWSMSRLSERGYRYVLVPMTDAEVDAVSARNWLTKTIGPPVASDTVWALWTIDGSPLE
jgi:hypothetical protein